MKENIFVEKKFRSVIIILSFLFFSMTPLPGQFILNGSATQLDQNCYQLTSAAVAQIASIWKEDQIDLTNSFDFNFNLNLGCNDIGADGMVFVLQNNSNILGQAGGDIGYGIGFDPSIAIEFDTYRNDVNGDVSADHIAILRDGNVNHNNVNNLAGPVNAANTDNIEDCNYHPVRISWNSSNLLLEVYFDCELRLSYSGDVVTDIFGGDPIVYWGFTASTGGETNVQSVCFDSTEGSTSGSNQTISLCEGNAVELSASQQSDNYSWTPSIGLSDPNLTNPVASPSGNITYFGMGTDACDNVFMDTFNIEVSTSIIDYQIEPSFVTTILCAGETIDLMVQTDSNNELTWQDNSTNDVYIISQPGTYELTISNACLSETISLEVEGVEDCKVTMPNIFTPDGDGLNDYFAPVTGSSIKVIQFKIFNRWGAEVFNKRNQQGWDGTIDGKAAVSDVYVYVIEYILKNGNKEFLSGDVTLIR